MPDRVELVARVFSLADYYQSGSDRVTYAPGLTIGPEVVERVERVAEHVVRCDQCYSTAGCPHVNWGTPDA